MWRDGTLSIHESAVEMARIAALELGEDPPVPDPGFWNRDVQERGGNVAMKDRGFASMDRNKQRAIASKGGKSAHAKGTAHEWTTEEARAAGRKGGAAASIRRNAAFAAPEAAR